jgi:hypothetical protein
MLKYMKSLINRFLIILLLVFVQGINSQVCDTFAFDQDMQNELKLFKKNARSSSAINTGEVIWPTCKEIEKHRIFSDEIAKEKLENSFKWICEFLYCRRCGFLDSVVLLKEMNRGDDWIAERKLINGQYIQYIDGRIFTFLARDSFDLKDKGKLRLKISGLFEKYIQQLYGDLLLKKIINFDYDSLCQIEATIIRKCDTLIVDKSLFPQIWLNNKYIVVTIPKIKKPYYDKFGFDASKSINGIPVDDPRPFKRFGKSGNLDMKNEMVRQFPWVKDTIDFWKKNPNRYLGGEPPVYK